MGAQRHKVVGEHLVGGEQTFDRDRQGNIGDAEEVANIVNRQDEHRGHTVGPVDQGETLFFPKFDGGDSGSGERVGGLNGHTFAVSDTPFSHEDERAVGEWRKVTRAPERSVFINNWRESGVEHGGIGFDHDGANSSSTGHERRQPLHHESANDFGFNLVASPRSVRTD